MSVDDLLLEGVNSDQVKHRTVVRLRRSTWQDCNGAYQRTDIRFLRRKSSGDANVFQEDCDMAGAAHAVARIVNLSKCDDGEYVLAMCNISRDHESGYIDDWDYKLIPLEEQECSNAKPSKV